MESRRRDGWGHAPGMDAAELFWALHTDLPREGVGSDATTRALLDRAGTSPREAPVLDIGCGPGPASLVLAAEGFRVTGVDTHEPFLRRLRRAARDRGLDRIGVARASMAALPHPDGAFDLLWAEGSAYILGVDAALAEWRRLLRPSGVLVLTEVGWTTDTPSAAAREFWAASYPGMRSPAATAAAARSAGYDVVATYELPESDWWAEYYEPLAARIDSWSDADPAVRAGLAAHRGEIELRRRHPGDYAYTGYVLRRA